MSKKRTPVPTEMAAQVLFASDRTCCVCREPRRKVEIHHIDSDPSNNAFSNLAVVCKDCQSDAHTDHAFARNLTPEIVTLYNVDWRSIVASRRNPDSDIEILGYRASALYDFASEFGALRCNLYSLAHQNGHEWIDTEVDGLFRHRLDIEYSRENWDKYRRLFERDAPKLIERLEKLVLIYAGVVPISLKVEVMNFCGVVPDQCGRFLALPFETQRLRPPLTTKDLRSIFANFFSGLMGAVKKAEQNFRNAYETVAKEFESASASTRDDVAK